MSHASDLRPEIQFLLATFYDIKFYCIIIQPYLTK